MILQVISEVRAETRFTLYAYVIMPDHLHFVLSTPQATPSGEVMRRIKGRFANRWNRHSAGRGAVWQPRYHERALRTEHALQNAVDYVHWNPAVAKLVASPEDYRWSSALSWIREANDGVRLSPKANSSAQTANQGNPRTKRLPAHSLTRDQGHPVPSG
jgi:REP element-mobilizing transposase RayT